MTPTASPAAGLWPNNDTPQPPQPAALRPATRSPQLYRHAEKSSRSADSLRTSDSIDIEKDAASRCHDATNLSSPKPCHVPQSPRESRHSRHDSIQAKYEVYDLDDTEQEPLNKAIKILIFLCGPLPALCFVTLLWTLVAALYSVAVQSCRALTGEQNFRGHLTALLAPAYRFQARCIYHYPATTEYRLGKLLVLNLLAPILSAGMVLMGCVAAMFWACSAIVGNPGGSEGGNDAREAVMTLRRWWFAWLEMALVRR